MMGCNLVPLYQAYDVIAYGASAFIYRYLAPHYNQKPREIHFILTRHDMRIKAHLDGIFEVELLGHDGRKKPWDRFLIKS